MSGILTTIETRYQSDGFFGLDQISQKTEFSEILKEIQKEIVNLDQEFEARLELRCFIWGILLTTRELPKLLRNRVTVILFTKVSFPLLTVLSET